MSNKLSAIRKYKKTSEFYKTKKKNLKLNNNFFFEFPKRKIVIFTYFPNYKF